MAQSFAIRFYDSKAWKKCRLSYIAERISIDGGMCEKCHSEVGYIVHHKDKLTLTNIDNTEVTLNHNNLEYVCHLCHNKIDQEQERYYFDSTGQIVPVPPFKDSGV